jgi:hypothetical protein
MQTKDINNLKGRCGTRLSKWKHPRDALWAFCEETNTCGRGFIAECHLKISVTSPSGQYTEFCYFIELCGTNRPCIWPTSVPKSRPAEVGVSYD